MKIVLKDGTGTVDLKHLHTNADRHGNLRLYVRLNGQYIRIRETVGTEAFITEYKTAVKLAHEPRLEADPAPNAPARRWTIKWLFEQYYDSDPFLALGPSTRTVRRGVLDAISQRIGNCKAMSFEKRHVKVLTKEKTGLPEAANAIVKALRQVYKWAAEEYPQLPNPVTSVAYVRSGGDGWHTWTVDEVRQFEQTYPIGTRERLAMALLLYLGVRKSDLIGLGRQLEYDQGRMIRFTEFKGRRKQVKVRELPILPELREVLAGTKIGHLTYVVTEFGKPFTNAGFGNWFRGVCDDAGLNHCSAHGLRKAGATIAADNGATEFDLMSIYGWESPKQAALYTRRANRKRIAGRAMKFIVPLTEEQRAEEQKVDVTATPARVGAKGVAKKAKRS